MPMKNGKMKKMEKMRLKNLNKPIGFRPMLTEQFKLEKKPCLAQGFFKTAKKHSECQIIIGEQFSKWLSSGAIQFIGRVDEITTEQTMEYCHTCLPLSIERGKPRCCCDGGPLKCISPEKIPCKLDAITDVIQCSKEGAYYCKTDDSSGFLNCLLNPWSSAFCGLRFGNLLFAARGLPFGLTQVKC